MLRNNHRCFDRWVSKLWAKRGEFFDAEFSSVFIVGIFKTITESRNRFQGIDSASLCSLADRYNNPIPSRFLAPIDCSKIPALAGQYDNPVPTWFLAPIDCSKIPAQYVNCENGILKWRLELYKTVLERMTIQWISCWAPLYVSRIFF